MRESIDIFNLNLWMALESQNCQSWQLSEKRLKGTTMFKDSVLKYPIVL